MPRFTVSVLTLVMLLSAGVWAVPVTVDEAGPLLEGKTMWILDVRSPEEFASGHLPGAHLIPVQELEARIAEVPADPSAPLFVYCKTGRRSNVAYKLLTQKGYQTIYTLTGGVMAWQAAGKPTVRRP